MNTGELQMKKNCKLLIVEDEVIYGLLLENSLKKCGFIITDNVIMGKSAIQSAKDNQPDVILMDIRLADNITGIEAAKEIQSFSDIPIIFMTAYIDDEIKNEALTLNPLAYLIKPITTKQIIELIDSI